MEMMRPIMTIERKLGGTHGHVDTFGEGLARPRAGAFSDYQVPRQNSQTVLDVVTYIQRHLEPSLSYRFACRVGMCGSCAMTVNGKARWTCRTHVAKVVDGKGRSRSRRSPTCR